MTEADAIAEIGTAQVEDLAAVAKRGKAIQAAQRAREAYEVARVSQRDAAQVP